MIFSTLDLALDYVALNPTRYIFPIKALAKFPPLVRDNLQGNASNDPIMITAWHKRWPGCNWGLALAKSGILCADVDTNALKGKLGQQTYDLLDLDFGWPDTEIVTTPSGGHHHYYVGKHIFSLGKYGFGEAIDSPNYVLIEGCTFKDGTSYVGNGKCAVPAPQWMYDLLGRAKVRIESASEAVVELDKPENIASAIDYLQNDAEPAIEGKNGDQTTFNVSCYVHDLGISEHLANELMLEHYNDRCEPPWDTDDLAKKIANGYAYANLSKAGGKTAEADFSDDDAEEVAASMGAMVEASAKSESARKKRVSDKKAKTESKAEAKIKDASDPKKPWNSECAIIVQPPSFIDLADRRLMSAKSFNKRYGAIGGASADKKADVSKTIARYRGVCYRPGAADVVEIDGFDRFNMYHPQDIEPMDGEPERMLRHLDFLIPDDESRRHFINWLAWTVQRPDQKTMFAVLLLGVKGTGKSWFAELFKVIFGAINVSEPSRKRVASEFNGWLANRRMIVIHELREKGARGLYDELKEYITQRTIDINPKGVEPYTIDSYANFLTITNHDDAIPIDDQERRYLVIRCADSPALGKGTEESAAYYSSLFECIGTPDEPGEEARRALNFLMKHDLTGFNGCGVAPETEAKDAMVEAGLSDLEHWMIENAENWPLRSKVISLQDVVDSLPKRIESKTPRLTSAITAVLRERFGAEYVGNFRLKSGNRVRLWGLRGHASMLARNNGVIAGIYENARAKAGAGTPVSDDGEDASTEFSDDT